MLLLLMLLHVLLRCHSLLVLSLVSGQGFQVLH
jgi:hypothetical protein